MNQIPNIEETHNTREVEELIEQLFQYYDDIDCAETVDQRITAKEQAELWLKRTLTYRDTYWKERVGYALMKHHDSELAELFRSDNKSETKEYIRKGLEVYKTEFMKVLDNLK